MSAVTGLLLVVVLSSVSEALDNGVARTPPMGWNSWNHFNCAVSAKIMEQTTDKLIELGLADAGYVYVNSDDCWLMLERNATGHLVPDPVTFPGGDAAMRSLSAYIHSKGLKFGIYGAAGETTCARRAGSLYHEAIDAETYASWNVDYLKYDDCGEVNIQSFAKFQAMRDALNETGRAIVYSYEPHETVAIEWPPLVGNAWRTGHDIGSHYESMFSDLTINNAWAHVGGPGAWNDADMLEVGNPGLSVTEAQSHFALWCLIKSPLLIGCDLATIAQGYLDILKNKEMIAISQDPLGVQGSLVSSADGPTRYTIPIHTPTRFSFPAPVPSRLPSSTAPFGLVTDCQFVDATHEQKWTLGTSDNDTIAQDTLCLTRHSSTTTVTLEPCSADRRDDQAWAGLHAVRRTVSTLTSNDGINCLATNGTALFMEPCISEPADCARTRCASSLRVRQLWYATRHTGQLISSFTDAPIPPVQPANEEEAQQQQQQQQQQHVSPSLCPSSPLINVPQCLASTPNRSPPSPPPAPPNVDPSKPLQVWAGPLSGNRVAAVLSNADSAAANVTAHWADLRLAPSTRVSIRDVIAHADRGQSTGPTLTASVASHGVAVFILTIL